MVRRGEREVVDFPIAEIVPILVADEKLRAEYWDLANSCTTFRADLLKSNMLYNEKHYDLLFNTILDHWKSKYKGEAKRTLVEWLNKKGFSTTADTLAENFKLPSPSKREKTMRRRSEIDKSRCVVPGQVVVSLIRFSRKTNHIFTVCEMFSENGVAQILFFDLVAGSGDRIWIPNSKPGKVRTKGPFHNEPGETTKLKYKYQGRIMAIQKGQKAYTLDMPMENFHIMLENLKADQAKPPIFNILGNESLSTASSALSFQNECGHSCFTFAKSHVLRAYPEANSIFPNDPAKFVISIPGDSLFGEYSLFTFLTLMIVFGYLAYFFNNYTININRKL